MSSARAFRGGVTRSMLKVRRDFRERGPRADRASSQAKARFPIDPWAETTSRPSLRRTRRYCSETHLEGRGGGSESSHFLQKWRVVTCVCVKSARGIAPRTASLLFCQLCNAESSSPLHFYPVFFLRSRSLDKLRIIPERACLHCVFRRLSGLANQNRLGFRCHAGFCESKNCLGVVPGDRTVFRETVEINSKNTPL